MRPIQYSLIFLLISSVASAEEIPLDHIWGYRLPGTKKVRELEDLPDGLSFHERMEQSRVLQILRYLSNKVDDANRLQLVFVVEGHGKTALENAAKAFKEGTVPDPTISAGKEASIVFFCYGTAWPLRLESVEQEENLLTIQYRFVDDKLWESFTHFALIPIEVEGKVRQLQVKVDALPAVDRQGRLVEPTYYRAPGTFETKVSGSRSFQVE